MYAFVLCGPPGCGKTTMRQQLPNWAVASTDDYIEDVAKSMGKTYKDVFEKTMDYANILYWSMLKKYGNSENNIIIDRTNLDRKSRAKLFEYLPRHTMYAVYSPNIDFNVLKERVNKRGEETGKVIPDHVLKNMYSRYETPLYTEGFEAVIPFNLVSDFVESKGWKSKNS